MKKLALIALVALSACARPAPETLEEGRDLDQRLPERYRNLGTVVGKTFITFCDNGRAIYAGVGPFDQGPVSTTVVADAPECK